jgi:hypothetical protein
LTIAFIKTTNQWSNWTIAFILCKFITILKKTKLNFNLWNLIWVKILMSYKKKVRKPKPNWSKVIHTSSIQHVLDQMASRQLEESLCSVHKYHSPPISTEPLKKVSSYKITQQLLTSRSEIRIVSTTMARTTMNSQVTQTKTNKNIIAWCIRSNSATRTLNGQIGHQGLMNNMNGLSSSTRNMSNKKYTCGLPIHQSSKTFQTQN